MRLRPSLLALAPALCAVLVTHPLGAQRVLGPAADATVVPRGMLRVSIGPEWGRGTERYANGAGRRSKGTAEPLATDFILDTLGVRQLPDLAQVRTSVAGILGSTSPLPITLGALEARFDASVARTPIVVEFGVTRRLTIGAMIPLVKTWTEVSIDANASRTGSTVGINPAYTLAAAQASNALVVTQLQAAIQALSQRLQLCVGSSTAECAAVNADRARAQALVLSATTAATDIERLYGTSSTKRGLRYVPVDSSSIQKSIAARLGTFSTDFATFLGAPVGGSSWVAARPVGAAPFSWGGLQRVVTDTAYQIRGDSLISVGMNRLGDVELGARFLVYDGVGDIPQRASLGGFRLRVAAEGVVRLGTGTRDSVNHFADIGTGDGQRDLEGRLFADLLFGRRAWASVGARYTLQQADEIRVRIPGFPGDPFPAAASIATVQRDLGEAISIEASPRLVVSDNMAIAGTWQWYRKAGDAYATTAAGLDAGTLTAGSERDVQRALLTLTYSSVAPYFRGKARAPMEVSLSVGRTLSGSGHALRQSFTALTLRMYNQVLEGRR